MAIGPFPTYTPPGVTVSTSADPSAAQNLGGIRVPVLIGVGKETLSQSNYEMVRGSSSVADTPIFGEDVTGRWVSGGTLSNPVLGNQDGSKTQFKVRNVPIVDGSGRGLTTFDVTKVSVTVNNESVIVSSVDGVNGLVTILVPPNEDDVVLVNYFFHRKDVRITDNLSQQISAGLAILTAPKAEPYSVVSGTNDTLTLVVNDLTTYSVNLTAGTSRPAADVANDVNAANITGLTASIHVDADGLNHVRLTAAGNITISSGNANGVFGFNPGVSTSRNKSFRTFQGPIVDGSDGGIITTDITKVSVLVNGQVVIASSVDGLNSLVTLPFAPTDGSTVNITYYFNTFQDTFDYLPNTNIVNVGNVGIGPGRRDYINGQDFVVTNDGDQSRIQWGATFNVSSGVQTGNTAFNSTQIVGLLVDNRVYGSECSRFVDPVLNSVSTSKFVLPLTPTTGNGRDTPLGVSLYQTVTNGRIDLPTNRPDLVIVHVGKNWRDASSRPPVAVTEVDGTNNTVTLKSPVPADYKAFATFWYNRIVDDTYTFSVVTPGPSSIGTYTIASALTGVNLYGTKFGTKSGLPETIQWPSGSEQAPDVIHTGAGNPTSETVTVTFSNALNPATHASFSNGKQEPYDIYAYSQNFGGVVIDGNAPVTVNLSTAFRALLLGNPVASVTPLSTDRLLLVIDGITLAPIDISAATTLSDVATAINAAVDADTQVHADGSGTFLSSAPNALASVLSYGSENAIVIRGRSVPSFTNGLVSSVLVLPPTGSGQTDGSTKIGLSPNASAQGSYNSINQVASYVATKTAPYNVTAGVNDSVQINVDGVDVTATIPSGSAVTLNDVVTSINDVYIEYASAADVATYTADVIALANNLRTKYEAHRVSTVFHVIADAVNTISAPVAVTLGDSLTLLNDIKTKFNLHLSQAGIHQLDDTLNVVTTANASNLVTAVRLANDLKDAFNLHLTQRGVHGKDDATNTLTPASAPVIESDCYPILNDLKAKYNAHRVLASAHLTSDTVNIITATNAVDSPTALALANELKADFNLHLLQSGVHVVDDVTNNITSANATNSGTLITLTTELQTKYPLHLAEIQGIYHVHGTNDTTNPSAFFLNELVARTGQGINSGKLVLTSRINTVNSLITIKTSGNANLVLGLEPGLTVQRSQPTAKKIANALNANSSFSSLAFAYQVPVQGLGNYLTVNSRSTGNSSTVAFSSVANSALIEDTGLGIVVGSSGDIGENAQSGFTVASSQGLLGSHGTGFPGQTYTDSTTGLRFTVLPASSGDYTSGGSFTLVVNQTFVTDASLPIRAVNGVELTVYNTFNMNPGTTSLVRTYDRSGIEPQVGDVYYISYDYAKSDISTQLYRDSKKIIQAFGSPTPDSPLSLAARIAQLNGAVVVGLKQVFRSANSSQAPVSAYISAIDEQKKKIGGSTPADVVIPLTSNTQVFGYLNQHCVFMSAPRQEGERTGVVGVATGTSPLGVQSIARSLNSELVTVVYPDSFVISVQDSLGNLVDQLVDGTYAAAAYAASTCNPTFDVASPLTRRSIQGFRRIGRVLDPTEANQIAVNGVTIIEQVQAGLRVRHALTTNVDSVLTRTPSVVLTIQYVQKVLRQVLDPYIGQKLTGNLIKSVETAISGAFTTLIDQQIVTSVAGIEVASDENDPTILRVSAIYVPVFPLEYIVATLSVRVRS